MKKQIEQLIEFHKTYNCPIAKSPRLIIAPELRNIRAKLMAEELIEFNKEMDCGLHVADLGKELCDLLYVVLGTAITYGFQDVLERCFDEVHRSNMSKLGADGKPILREDGKVLKGPNYSPANLDFLTSK